MSRTEIGRTGTEAEHVTRVKARGGVSLKFVSPGTTGMPDRLDLYPIAEEHREIVARYIQFTECKAPGKKPRTRQARMHKKLRELGFVVNVYDGGNNEQ